MSDTMTKALLAFVCLLSITCTLAGRTIVAKRDVVPYGWTVVGKPDLASSISFSILLKQKNLDQLSAAFDAISNPKNERWGKFMTQKQIADMVRPDQEAFDAVDQWLAPIKDDAEIEVRADSVRVTTNVGHAQKLFKVGFFVHSHDFSNKEVIRIGGAASIPDFVAEHVDFVAGISELFVSDADAKVEHDVAMLNFAWPVAEAKPVAPKADIIITPTILKNYYNVPNGTVGTQSSNLQGIAAFTDYFSMGALRTFEQNQGLPTANVTRQGPDCFPNCDQYESDLDIQYITAMGENINTIFLNQPANYWILQFAEDTEIMTNPPLVFSVSYGWSELEQCAIAVVNCANLGYTSIQYVTRTNTELQKLGNMGVTVLVSDGDDGAPSLGGASGNCPVDPNHYCPTGGCQHSSSACNGFQIYNTSSEQYCFFPMGLGTEACGVALQDPNINYALGDFFSANPSCNFNIETDSSNMPHFYSTCNCNQIQSATSNGYVIGQYVFNANNGPVFTADYPTSSPYVTSVGASQFINEHGVIIKEVAASILTGAIITTGGGFSSFQPMPSYQQTAVSNYIQKYASTLPPSFTYNTQFRAYPDIAFNGHHYLIFYSNNTSDQCPCPATAVDGTSCSSPALAGLISLINDRLLAAGKSQLGFLNQLLYQMYADYPAAFNDITNGNNNCNRAYCCIYGYQAVPGYDVVSGLGSPDFANMLNYILKQKGL